jgi:hypothetical protein
VAALIEIVKPRRSATDQGGGWDWWTGLFGLGSLPSMLQTTMQREEERADGSFSGLVYGAYLRNSVVFSCLALRARLFAEARYQFQQLRNGKPGNLFGTAALSVLEHPERGKSTRDLASIAILDADLGGGGFLLGRQDAIRRLRPDWMTIAYGSARGPSDLGAWDPDAEVIGYGYYPGGYNSGEKPIVFLPEEIAHFAPTKDPLAHNRGVSLLVAGLREVLSDNAAISHKLSFFENAATPNLALKFPATMSREAAEEWIDLFEEEHKGALNAWKTVYLGAGVEPMPVGLNFQEMDFAAISAKAETRIAALTGMHPVVAALSEGLAGSSLNAGNFASAARLVGDATLRPLWGDFSSTLQTIVPPLPGTRLWYDDSDIAFLRDDVKDRAEIQQSQGATIRNLADGGWDPQSVVDAVIAEDWSLLRHTGLLSVQLQPPGQQPALGSDAPTAMRAARRFWAVSAPWSDHGVIEAGASFPATHGLVRTFPSLFTPEAAQLAAGPAPIVSRERVLAKRSELAAAGRPSGIDSLARELGVSRDTVRRRLAGS